MVVWHHRACLTGGAHPTWDLDWDRERDRDRDRDQVLGGMGWDGHQGEVWGRAVFQTPFQRPLKPRSIESRWDPHRTADPR